MPQDRETVIQSLLERAAVTNRKVWGRVSTSGHGGHVVGVGRCSQPKMTAAQEKQMYARIDWVCVEGEPWIKILPAEGADAV